MPALFVWLVQLVAASGNAVGRGSNSCRHITKLGQSIFLRYVCNGYTYLDYFGRCYTKGICKNDKFITVDFLYKDFLQLKTNTFTTLQTMVYLKDQASEVLGLLKAFA